jgi:hypothetical protein
MGLAIMAPVLLLGVTKHGNFGTSRVWLGINRWLEQITNNPKRRLYQFTC